MLGDGARRCISAGFDSDKAMLLVDEDCQSLSQLSKSAGTKKALSRY